TIDWERRYRLMRYHTGSHILDGVVQKATGALVTGNQLAIDKTRIDFALENFDKGMLKDFEDKANEIISRNLPVHIKFLTREEVLKRPEMIKLAMGLPENQAEFRIIEIEGFDSQPCGGTHLKNTGEVGRIRITGAENKGKSNRRISFVVE
ncbi:MAG: alanyl-tRNA editing protein, partial [Candidatus Aenigmarchaeota archaeon]|nr:alanyl-tRNA editing protein [Candidatus Aenigmarchaeota archaeon]